ncbi:uncharacterized protein C8R40DRAFT_1081922 [Lentinula edodes]|uniref:uncharacterized protein n=1 Tax=Lentinula edodes TaxID=5353 RepID=UPI001E8D41D2|nr:uncharacterized protein C8R40DRAFT_1081922 [Lentinula edodes]KAH7880798.1 hypothetical protein C8R40DRAFT_1081922 [Lentinula edodes]
MSSSSASVTSTTTGSGDDSAPTNISNSSTSSASSTTTATATTSSERLSSLSSSAPSDPTSSSQSDLPSSSGTSAGSSTQAANGPSSTPPVPSGQSQSSVDGGQVAANSAGSIGTAGSTSVEVVTTQTFPSSTVTSTITGHPDSTLSTPSGITVSSNGRLSTTFPALITVVSTSTNANGAETVWTSIVANPTNEVSGDVADAHSFLHNEGAVAGVFTVVGIAFTAAVVAIFMICRRRRRRKIRRNQWIDNIQKRLPEPEDPFENPREAPVMRSMSQTSRNEQHYHFQSPSPTTAQPFFHSGNPWDIDEEFRSPPGGIVQSNSLGLTSIDATRMSPFSDSQYPHQEHIGLAVTTSSPPAHQSRPSLAQSSPSIYPPSIPLPNDNASVYEDIDLMGQSNEPTVTIPNPYIYPSEAVAGPPSPISPGDGPFDDLYSIKPLVPTPVAGYPPPPVALPGPRASTAPLRPTRSALREASKVRENHQTLATPPPSLSGHENSAPDVTGRDADSPSPSATSGLSSTEAVTPGPQYSSSTQTNQKQRPRSASKSIEDIVMRRTLLDVRPRSRDNVQNSGRM